MTNESVIDLALAGRVCDVLLKVSDKTDWDALPVNVVDRLKYMLEAVSVNMDEPERFWAVSDRNLQYLTIEVLEFWVGVGKGVPHYWKLDRNGDLSYKVEYHLPAGYKTMPYADRIQCLIDSYEQAEEQTRNREVFCCCLCSDKVRGYGNNARPLKDGQCCDQCNTRVVLARLMEAAN